MGDLHARLLREALAQKVRNGARARRGEGRLVAGLARPGQVFGHGAGAGGRAGGDGVVHQADATHGREVLHRVVAQLLVDPGKQRHRSVRHQHQRVAVRARLARGLDRQAAGRAGAVLDDHVAAQQRAHGVGQGARGQVDRAAGREAHQDLHRRATGGGRRGRRGRLGADDTVGGQAQREGGQRGQREVTAADHADSFRFGKQGSDRRGVDGSGWIARPALSGPACRARCRSGSPAPRAAPAGSARSRPPRRRASRRAGPGRAAPGWRARARRA